MNCTVVIEIKEDNHIQQNCYQFDDYRVAVALCNILDNVNNVTKTHNLYDNKTRGKYMTYNKKE